jgi:hypothetical protein
MDATTGFPLWRRHVRTAAHAATSLGQNAFSSTIQDRHRSLLLSETLLIAGLSQDRLEK